jgi:hypothetical protein
MQQPKKSLIQRSPEMLLAAYFLSRCSVKAPGKNSLPPAMLGTKKWNAAYELLFPLMGEGRTQRQFANSLKNARDTFDILFDNGRIGWIDANGKPSPISPKFRDIHTAWEGRADSELEAEIGALITAGHTGQQPAIPSSEMGWTQEATDEPRELRNRIEAASASLSKFGSLPPPPPGSAAARATQATASRFVRDPSVIAWVLAAARGTCESCEKRAPFSRSDQTPFLEVHHLKPLADGGPDTTDNAAACCPNCHREMHFGENGPAMTAETIKRVTRLKEY